MTTHTLVRIAAALAVGGVLLTGCTNPPSPSPAASATGVQSTGPATPAGSEFNEADVMFAQMMIPHHAQAVEMSDIVLAKDGIDDQVRSLAGAIREAQAPEIETMSGWLKAWGFGAAPTAMEGMGHGDGMLSRAEIDALRAAQGEAADALFLKGMIAHHEGAIAMANDELRDGVNPDAKELAQAIITSQQSEIELMQGLLR